MSDFKIFQMPAFARGGCVVCCRISENQEDSNLCNRCKEIICARCRTRDYVTGAGYACLYCIASIISVTEAQILLCIAANVQPYRIPKRRIAREEARRHAENLVLKGYLQEKVVGLYSARRVTQPGENALATAVDAYSQFPSFKRFLAEVSALAK